MRYSTGAKTYHIPYMLPTSLTLKSALWPTVFALFYIFCKITAKPTGFGSHAIHGQQCVALVKIVQRGLKRTSLRAEGRHARVARPPRLGDLSTGAQSLAAATPLVAYSPSTLSQLKGGASSHVGTQGLAKVFLRQLDL